jgi:hypothetical protein
LFFSLPKKLIESFFGRGDDDDVLTLFGVIGLISLFPFFIFSFLFLSGDVRRFKRDNPAGLSGEERGSDPEKDPAEGGGTELELIHNTSNIICFLLVHVDDEKPSS